MKWKVELDLAKDAAVAAGHLLKIGLEESKQVLSNEGKDLKLQNDKNSEKLIIETLQTKSNYPILSEECGCIGEIRNDEPYWVIDPLDGTVNYFNGIPLCAVSIALWVNEQPILGVIHLFLQDELLYGVVGQGAFINENRIILTETTKPVNQSILSTGFPLKRDYSEKSLKKFIHFSSDFKKVRMFGSAALSLAYVCLSRTDVYWEENIMFWDVAAGLAIIKSLGGNFKMESTSGQWEKHIIAKTNCDIEL